MLIFIPDQESLNTNLVSDNQEYLMQMFTRLFYDWY